MQRSLPILTVITAGALATSMACSDDDAASDAGSGAAGAGGATAGSGADAGSGGSLEPGECGGPAPPQGGSLGGSRRITAVQCYVAPAIAGEPECLPADDPAVVGLVADFEHISSMGFVTEFVMGPAPWVALSPGCETLYGCCERMTGTEPEVRRCYDLVDRPENWDYCERRLEFCAEASGGASGGGAGQGGAAGASAEVGGAAGASAAGGHALCCYEACGYIHAS